MPTCGGAVDGHIHEVVCVLELYWWFVSIWVRFFFRYVVFGIVHGFKLISMSMKRNDHIWSCVRWR